ncbi:hypothetical protein [Olivibacter sp. XZL3]|uniref:hypothetical protein n=1 Tax=Olivibacter sp. XZL3 TaxID=1735116 RepID=UPI001065E04A|nr:hypothetical protein [Olivibacter sp. XZL3]
MNIVSNEKKWLRLGLILLIGILSFGVLQALAPAVFLTKVSGTVQEIQQKYSGAGAEKLITISFTGEPILMHRYVNKDYLPSPEVREIKDELKLTTYTRKGKDGTFYGLELVDGTIIQSKRWDLLSAYLNAPIVAFALIAIPIGLYLIYGKKLLQTKPDQILFIGYVFMLAFVWGKLHFFLMMLLILGLVQLGKRFSNQKGGQAVKEMNFPIQT